MYCGGSIGQARKSLWIETQAELIVNAFQRPGQARKSLWIETLIGVSNGEQMGSGS